MKNFYAKLYFLLTGRCVRFSPDSTGLCRNCRIPGAGA